MPATTTALSANDVFNAFITNVYSPITTGSPAVYHSGNQHPAAGGVWPINSADYGSSTEPTFTAASIPDTQTMHGIIHAYYAVHDLAMQLTRIRMAQVFYTNGSWTVTAGTSNRTALKSGLELFFPIPAGVPAQGTVGVTAANLNAFLASLATAVSSRRNDAAYQHVFVSQWCHSNCHGSRGRR